MTRRRLLLLALPVALVLLGIGMWLLRPQPRVTVITRVNAAKIEMGMTLAQVEDVLGGPARDESSGPLSHEYGGGGGPDVKFRCRWCSDEVIILVFFDASDRVRVSPFLPVERLPEESLFQRVRGWLGL